MKQKLVIALSLILLIGVIFLIYNDLFNGNPADSTNATEYNLEKLKQIDSSLICYNEVITIDLTMESVNALTIDSNSNIYVAGDNEIQIFDKTLQKTHTIKLDSSANCLAVFDNTLYLGVGNYVEVYTSKGVKLSRWKSFNSKGYITSIAVNKTNVYAADAENKAILRYNLNGVLLNVIGKKDKDKSIDGFIIPSMYFDLAISAENELWVANPGKHELINFTEKGDFRTSWGIASMQTTGFAGCCNPIHFCMLSNGSFVTFEKGLDRIKLHDQTGKLECIVASFSDANAQALDNCSIGARVHDLATDLQGNIYALDAKDKKIRVFSRK